MLYDVTADPCKPCSNNWFSVTGSEKYKLYCIMANKIGCQGVPFEIQPKRQFSRGLLRLAIYKSPEI